MVAVQVIGNDTAVGMAASQGNFELNVFMPVLIYNFLQSARLLADSLRSFNKNCVSGITANHARRCITTSIIRLCWSRRSIRT